MRPSSILQMTLATLVAGFMATAFAQSQNSADRGARAEQHQPAGKGLLRLLPADAVTEHAIDTARGRLAYTATAGTLPFYDQSGEQSAAVFYTAYVAKTVPRTATRTAAPIGP